MRLSNATASREFGSNASRASRAAAMIKKDFMQIAGERVMRAAGWLAREGKKKFLVVIMLGDVLRGWCYIAMRVRVKACDE